ncbi:class III lanthipeptide [Alkalihalobacillus sp. NPDC127517]
MNQVLDLQKLNSQEGQSGFGKTAIEKTPATITVTTTAVGWSTASNDC